MKGVSRSPVPALVLAAAFFSAADRAQALECGASPSFDPSRETITIKAVGDIVLGTTWPKDQIPADVEPRCFAGVKKQLAGGDIVFGKPHAESDKGTALSVHEVTVECYRPLTATVAEVRFFVTSGEFSFKPGQYMIFHIPDAERRLRRSYSISTPPSDRRHFEVCVRAIAGGAGSNFIHRLRIGRRLKVEGPFGEFA